MVRLVRVHWSVVVWLFGVLFGAELVAQENPRFRPFPGGIKGEYVVVLEPLPAELVEPTARALARQHGAQLKDIWRHALQGFWAVMPETAARAMSANPRVRYVEQNARLFSTSVSQPTDGVRPTDRDGVTASGTYPVELGPHPLWHLWRLNHRSRTEPKVYSYAPQSTGSGVRIYAVDSGVLRFHQEFVTSAATVATDADKRSPASHDRVKEVAGSNVTDSDPLASSAPSSGCTDDTLMLPIEDGSGTMPYRTTIWFADDAIGHGTAVGSMAGGRNVGVAKEVEIVPVKVIGCDNQQNTAYFIRAFDWILRKAPPVPSIVTLSTYRTVAECQPWEPARCERLGGSTATGHLVALEDAVQALLDAGIPVVASANNNSRDACHDTPGRLSWSGGIDGLGRLTGGVITVGGLAKNADERWAEPLSDPKADSSNWGPCIDLWAPAEKIAVARTSGWNHYRTENFSGTSFSAPMVAGLIARMFSEDASLRADLLNMATRKNVPKRVWERLRDAATPMDRGGIFGNDTALREMVTSNPITAAVLYATPRRIAYMGAFTLAEQPASVVLTSTRATLRALPVGAPADETIWYEVDAGGKAIQEVARFTGTGDHSLCVQRGTAGCKAPVANTRYQGRVKRGGTELTVDSAIATVVVDQPLITLQPKSRWVPQGGSATVEVTALVPEGQTPSYQWYRGHPEQKTVIAGATSNRHTVTNVSGINGYFVEVLANGSLVTSEVAIVRAASPSTPPAHCGLQLSPLGGDVAPGQTFTVTALTTGSDLEYHWYSGNSGDTTRRITHGGHTLFGKTISLLPGEYARLWVRIFSLDRSFIDTPAIDLPRGCDMSEIEVSTEQGFAVTPGASRVISARVKTPNPLKSYHYQWYRVVQSCEGELLEKLVGFTTADVNVSPQLGSRFRVIVTDSTCSRISDAVSVRAFPTALSRAIPVTTPTTFTIFQRHTLSIPFLVPVSNSYQWLLGGSDFSTPAPVSCPSSSCLHATRTANTHEFLRLRVKDQKFAGGQASIEDSELIFLNVIPCGTSFFPITATPSLVKEGVPFRLEAPAMNGATYKWFRNDESTPFAETTTPFHDVEPISTRTRYFVKVSDGVCNPTAVQSQILTLDPCLKPRPRAVRHLTSPAGTPVPVGTLITLSVDDDRDGVTFQWFRGTSHSDVSTPLSTSPTLTVTATGTPSGYWVRMTGMCGGTPMVTNSDIVTIAGTCAPSIFVQPVSSTQQMPSAVGQSVSASATVVAGGAGPFTYEWSRINADGTRTVVGNEQTYTWGHVVSSTEQLYAGVDVFVKVTACNATVQSDTVRLAAAKTPQRIASYDEMKFVYSPLLAATLSVTMEPAPSPQHVYSYEWFLDDGSPSGYKLASTGPQISVKTESIANYWVRVSGQHTTQPDEQGNVGEYREVTTSRKMHVYLYGTCDLPPVKVAQSITTIPAGQTPYVTFIAVSDWHDVRFQWYRGQTGDVGEPIPSDAGKAHQLTVSSASIHPYWVRAWLECGATQDSPTLTYTRGACGPMLINQSIASSEVAFGGTATLSVDPVSGPAKYTWLRVTTGNIGAGSGAVYQPSDIRESRRYLVRVQNTDCGTLAESHLATVRVASCGTLTPPPWQTEIWADLNSTPTLNAQTTGATAYQWYRGELGDESLKIDGAVSATYRTPAVTADAKYWVRITNATCLVDSPTITVKVCVPPGVSTTPILNYNINPNQTVRFSVNAVGNDVTYQWYRGTSGDTSTPAGQPVDMLQVSPSVTTSYWLRLTGRCGAGGVNVRSWDSPTFTASVCPGVPAPTAAKSAVMSGTSTTLSVAATGTALSYRWYRGVAGNTSDLIASGTSNTITTPVITAATSFWVAVTSGGCTRNSSAVTVSLCSEPTVRWSTASKSVTKGESVTFTAIGTHSTTTPAYTFYKGNAGDVAGSTVVRAASTSNTFTAAVNETAKYWVRAAVDNCHGDSVNITITVCIPKITTQPVGGTITLNGSRSLSVATDITPIGGYQWYEGETGDLSKPVPNGTTASISVSPLVDTKYWVRAKGCSPYAADSVAVLVTVCTPAAVSSHTQSRWITKGDSQTLTVNVSGSSPAVQWYRGTAGTTTTPLGTTPSISVSPAETTQYWARVSNSCGSASTATITISVCAPPVITGQPASQGVFSGQSVTLSVAATQATSTPMTYQWYSGTAPSGSAIPGETGATYTTPPLTAAANYFVKITAGNCTTVSATAALSMCALPPTINSPADKEVSAYPNHVLKVILSPSPEQYRWYRGISGDRTNLISTSSQVSVNPSSTTKYWGEFIHGGCVSMGRTVTLTVCIPSINMHPDDLTIPRDSSATLTINARDAVSYQWYIGTSPGSGTPISGATAASYTTPPLTATTGYWVRVTGSCSRSVDTNVGLVTVQ
ncbi:MAG TPA: S8 family serine peptidase [Thermoanaerobaculia bacterium]|jgi:hypothetical protein